MNKYQHNSPQQWQFWVERQRKNPSTNQVFTEQEAKIHVSSFRKASKWFWIKRGLTEEQAKLAVTNHMKEMNKRAMKKCRGRKDWHTNQIGYWLKKGLTEEEAKVKVTERQTTFSLKKCIEKHGLDKGKDIWNNRQNKWQTTLNLKSEEEKNKINSLKALSLEIFVERLKDKSRALDEYCKMRLTRNYCTRKLSRLSDKAIIDETKKFLLRHNHFEYTSKIFNKYFLLIKRKILHKRGLASKESLSILIPLYKFCRKTCGLKREDIRIGLIGSREFTIKSERGVYHYDFTIISKKIIIEYNNLAWHPDPVEMTTQQWNSWYDPYNIKNTNQSIYEKHQHKMLVAKENGFDFFNIWTHKNINQQVENIKAFIYNKCK